MTNLKTSLAFGVVGAFALAIAAPGASAQSVESFYKGKNINVIVGNNAGGAYDAYARLLTRHMGKHIPGNPGFIVRNMTGAGTLIATNHIYNVAPKDGLTFGGVHERMGLEPKVAPEGTKYDGRKFTWIGSMAKQTSVCLTWHTTGIKTVDDARKNVVVAGGSGVAGSSAVFPRVMNSVLGTQFKLVTGYLGTDTDMALERGEIDSRCGFGYASLKATQPDWIRDNKVNIIVQFGLTKHKELPDVPLIMDLLTKDEDRVAMEVMLATQEMGRPFMAPPGVPADRATALQKAFDASMEDPALLAEAAKQNMEIDPISGSEIAALLNRLYDVPDAIYERVNSFRQPGSGEDNTVRKK